MWQLQHQAVVTVENIFDTEYRQHLSRIKSVMPEPGAERKAAVSTEFLGLGMVLRKM